MKNFFAGILALLLPYAASAQLSVSGKVTDNVTHYALPGATVSIKGKSIQTQTDQKGNYRLNLPEAGKYTFVITYIGYNTGEINQQVAGSIRLSFSISSNTTVTEEVTVHGTRAGANSPTTYTNINKGDIQKNNTGRGFEYLLEQTPSAVVSSNAGAGVGYTSIRIRGSDATRTNVTVNGVPMNDAEDQGVYFVDIPDLASSVDNIQVQRGVGTSTNGAGAFGASINIQTTTRHDTAYAQLDNSAGSYGTIKNSVSVGTGLLGDHFTFDGRLSRINSDGYIERSASQLKSYFLSGAYYNQGTVLRLNVFSGYEKTGQAWDGVSEDMINAGNRRYNELGYIDARGTYYNNQTDNYWQNFAQLLLNQKITSDLSFSGALHYTRGYGYYEEYQNDQTLADYGITPQTVGGTTITNSDLVRRLWLSNYFYGATYNLNYHPSNKIDATLGGAYNEYRGDHYNNIEWTQQTTNIPPDYEYSRDRGVKKDFNVFARADFHAGNFLFYGDMQYRHINYSFLGFDRDLRNVQQDVQLNFFNPKAGITYQLNDQNNIYASFAVGHHEPNRSDYTNSSPASRPKPETLLDWELGYRTKQTWITAGINAFYMKYKNQLILTGSLDDVGEAIRTNVDDSYRAGLEADARIKFCDGFNWALTASVSRNRVKNFHQFLYNDATGNMDETAYNTTNLAYSPGFIGSSSLNFLPFKGAEFSFISRYITRQYLDNTSTVSRSLPEYFVSDVRLNYNFKIKGIKNIGVGLLVNNVFSKAYSSDGATYPGIYSGQLNNYNYFFTQAPRNFLASLSLRF
ncbi:iron complex outermembrane receptor protein [Mucilaginibacter yixingensis]|uniref:Iron complex outermembrane receptor protein n=1 Tax=Mucilaginibacter yixingensis TaxID=1295612 RepID=A0A2T5JDT9_9SPHI|nr:TonB-dependent receptor [Mucilaginibacter yixingensis]PTQ99923.1 iron complex outermembrane receptor protein [Mucilaginibacter yixingensis]